MAMFRLGSCSFAQDGAMSNEVFWMTLGCASGQNDNKSRPLAQPRVITPFSDTPPDPPLSLPPAYFLCLDHLLADLSR